MSTSTAGMQVPRLRNSAGFSSPPQSKDERQYLEHLVHLSAIFVEAARLDPAEFGDHVLGFEPAPFHREWHDLCSTHDRLVLFAPRDHGKTSNVSVARALWELGNNPDLRIGIFSATEGQAKKILAEIKTNLLFNERLREVFPHLRPESRRGYPQNWTDTEIVVERSADAVFTQKDYSIQVVGYMGRFLGARLDLVIMDDVLDFENTNTEAQRDKTFDWLRAVLIPCLTPAARLWMVGTAWHEDDLAHRIEAGEMGEEFHVARYEAGTGSCVWAERWPPERLAERLGELGDVEYNRQYRNLALGAATGFFPIDAMRKCQELCTDPEDWWYGRYDRSAFRWGVLGLDLGASAHTTGNESSIFVLALDQENLKHPLYIKSGHWVGTTLLREVLDAHRLHANAIREWAVETNAAQLHVAAMLQDTAVMMAVGATYEEASAISVYGIYTTVSRDQPRWGIRAMAPEMQALKWRIPRGQAEIEKWIREAKKYVPAEHPGDRLMAGHFAHARMEGMGDPLPLMARSLSASALRRSRR